MSSVLPYKNSYEMTFQGTEYIVNIKAEEEKLYLLIEEKLGFSRWRGEYTSNFIEETTQKANSEKTYEMFVRMLLFAMEQKSERVFIDFITFQDIQMLKAKRSSKTQVTPAPATMVNPQQNTKRYVILT
jgi:hypothetical protein